MATVPQTVAVAATRPALRFTTAGSVDDGKSTLIGRLLHDSRTVYEDQLAAAHRRTGGMPELDLALLTDGLRAEREQGITIDVAYRYFSTPRRSFILADTPGHEQYTRNMATGASTAEAAVILLDATRALQPQARRHAVIAHLLGIRHLVAAVNKMDLVGYQQTSFQALKSEFLAFAERLGWSEIYVLPVSALRGDNVVTASVHTAWHEGPPLLTYLEDLEIGRAGGAAAAFRFPVQLVFRHADGGRSLAGQVASGQVRAGDEVAVWPSGRRARVARVTRHDGPVASAQAGQPANIELDRELDIGRGDVLAIAGDAAPQVADTLRASLVWIDDQPSQPGKLYWLHHGTRALRCRIAALDHRLELETLAHVPAESFRSNDIGQAQVVLRGALAFDLYRENRALGAFVLVDPDTHATAAAGMILGPASLEGDAALAGSPRWGHPPHAIWFDRQSDAARVLVAALRRRQWNVVLVPTVGVGLEALVVLARALRDAGTAAVFDGAGSPPAALESRAAADFSGDRLLTYLVGEEHV